MLYCQQAKETMSRDETPLEKKHPFIEWVDQVEFEKKWTDNKWTTTANLSASVLNNARNKGVIPRWDACKALAEAAGKSPITAFRRAGLLGPGPDDKLSLEDWENLLSQMTPEERDELMQIGLMRVERRQKEELSSRAENFKEGKVKR
jgi:hypothetical protein